MRHDCGIHVAYRVDARFQLLYECIHWDCAQLSEREHSFDFGVCVLPESVWGNVDSRVVHEVVFKYGISSCIHPVHVVEFGCV